MGREIMRVRGLGAMLLAATFLAGASHAAGPRRDLVEISRGQDYRGVTYVVSVDRASRKKVAEGIAITQYQTLERVHVDGWTSVVTEYVVDCAMPQYKTTREYHIDAAGKILDEVPIDRLTGGWRFGELMGGGLREIVAVVCTG